MPRLLPVALLVACHRGDSDSPAPPPAWDDPIADAPCAADVAAPLLERALTNAGIARDDLGWSDAEYAKASYAAVLDDAFVPPRLRELQRAPLTAPCFGTSRAGALSGGWDVGRPATFALREAITAQGLAIPDAPLDPSSAPTFQAGLDALLASTSDDSVPADESALPPGLGDALGPVLAAIAEVVTTWRAVDADAPIDHDRLSQGGDAVLVDLDPGVPLPDAAYRAWLLADDGPRALYGPTLRLAYAVETADLGRFAGQGGTGVLFEVTTRRGIVRIAGTGDDAPGEIDPVLLYVDLGGNDTYVHRVGANDDGRPIGVHLDLAGDDTYAYTPDPDPRDGARLPSDADGRYQGDANYGPFSLSDVGRQGSGRFGVGLLWDLQGRDAYTSLRRSQGWGHLGVGALVDLDGDDTYAAEAGAQGGAAFGIGLLLDGAGDDTYDAYAFAQGFAYVGAVGALVDRDGADRYTANVGDPALGGDPLYFSAQLPNRGNASFAQGVGFGRRAGSDDAYLSGGLGVLADGGGDDVYVASTFAQGSGYWQGLGVLSDRAGDDTYDALYYVQGGAAHYAVGMLLDAAGDDTHGRTFPPTYVHLGSGHDFSLGIVVDESGDDSYRYGGLAAGSSNCQGTGFFVDVDGTDTYEALSTQSTGLGNRSGECGADSGTRNQVHDIGLFLDAGGDVDAWTWPAAGDGRIPGNDASFGKSTEGVPEEHGAAEDGDGETALHAR